MLTRLIILVTMGIATAGHADTYAIPTIPLDESQTQQTWQTVTSEIDSWLGTLAHPQGLMLANACESYDLASKDYFLDYDPELNLIQYHGLYRYPEKFAATFLAHEYAHTIFRANIALLAATIDSDLAGSNDLRRLERAGLQELTPTQCEQGDRTAFENARHALEKNDYFTYDALKLGAYDELFADIFAVLYVGQGDAVYQAVGGAKVDWSDKYDLKLAKDYRGRDFTYEIPIKNWRADQPAMSFYDFLGAQTDFYNVLDPARGYIWRHYLKSLAKDKYAAFATGYLKAVGAQYRRFVSEEIWDEPVEDMNEAFLQALDEELQRAGVPRVD